MKAQYSTIEANMKNAWLRRLRYFCIYFLILLTIGLIVRDIDGQPGLLFSILDVANRGSPFGDPRTFAQAAYDIYQHGWLTTNYIWTIHLWPPGFMLLEGYSLKLFGSNAQIVLVLVILSAAFLAFVLTLLREHLLPILGNIWASVLPLLLLCFPVARVFLLEPAGIIFGETFAISCFLLMILFTLRAIDKKLLSNAIYAGVFFALSSYFRSQFELLVLMFSTLALPLIIWQGIAWFKQKDKSKCITKLFIIKTVVILLIVTHLLMLPWRIYHWVEIKRFSWVQTTEYIELNALASDKALLAHNGSFIIDGAGNLACKVEPTYCDKTDTSLFYKAFFHHIGEWYKIRASVTGHFWYSPLFKGLKDFNAVQLSDFIYNSILLLAILGIVPLLILLRKLPIWPVLLWTNFSFFSTFFVIFSLVQIEPRYFYLIKIYGVFMFIVLLSYYLYRNQLINKS